MDESNHCALSGDGALEFARSLENFDGICHPEDLKGDDCPNQITGISNDKFDDFADNVFMGKPIQPQEFDSVGAVAIDRNGNLACASSTGIVNNFTQVEQTHLVGKL